MDKKLLAIFLLYIMKNNKFQKIDIKNIQEEDILDIEYTAKKIKILKKVGPYLPKEFISILNKSLLITEKIIKIYDTMTFINTNESFEKVNAIEVKDNRERFDYIISTLKKEIPEDRINAMGQPANLILNYDKYKYMFNLFSTIITEPEKLNNPNRLVSLIEPLMKGKSEKEKENIKEMLKMAKIMMSLEPSEKKLKDPKTK